MCLPRSWSYSTWSTTGCIPVEVFWGGKSLLTGYQARKFGIWHLSNMFWEQMSCLDQDFGTLGQLSKALVWLCVGLCSLDGDPWLEETAWEMSVCSWTCAVFSLPLPWVQLSRAVQQVRRRLASRRTVSPGARRQEVSEGCLGWGQRNHLANYWRFGSN